MREVLAGFVLMNLAGAIAVALVLALRGAIRRGFGARVAYGLWMLVPLALAAAAAPARVVTVIRPAPETVEILQAAGGPALPAPAAAPAFEAAPWFVALWLVGMLASLAWVIRRQAQFQRAMQAGRAGPAVVGVLKPKIVLPVDFEARYTPRERQMILAHETTHIARRDPGVNALVAAARCAAWFNPLVHLAARCLRVDQELACDAEVVAAHPSARRAYAEAMLKTQLAARPLPLGCYWPAQAAHPLAERVGLLARALPGPRREAVGAATVGLLAIGAAFMIWAARPAHVAVLTAAPPSQPEPLRLAEPQPPAPVRPAPPKAASPTVIPAAAAPLDVTPVADPAPPAAAPPDADAPDPGWKVRGAAARSHVEPGWAVRVLATMTDRDGRHLVTDLTAYGSQAVYRTGRIERDGGREPLYTSVDQHGDTLEVTASLGGGFRPWTSASLSLASGQTGVITLPDGQTVSVTPTLRRETPDELAAAADARQRMTRRPLILASAGRDPFRCGRLGALC